jgi:predicted permease
LNGVFHPIITDIEAPLQRGMSEQTMTRFKAKEITLEEGRQGQSSVRGEARMPLTLLFATTAIVLLIACANIANLLLARGANRSMEMAVRLSLGATRWQIVRQLLLEACLLALLGGVASLLVAHWTFGLVRSFLPPDGADTLELVVGLRVVAIAAGLSVATGLIFGMFPALHSTRPELISVIRANTGQLTGARAATRFRMSLITAQIALSMALLISAGLFIKSLTNVSRVDLGLEADGIVTFAISPESNKYDPPRSRALFSRVEDEIAALPGVTSVAGALVPVLAGDDWASSLSVEGFQADADTDVTAWFNTIGPGFFRTLGIPILAGRDFTPADVSGAGKVAIVNEAFVKKFNLGRDVVGKHMAVGRRPPLDIQIVGLVRDAKYSSVKDTIPPQFFTPHAQDTTLGTLNFYVRTALPVSQTIQSIRTVMKKLDPNLPVQNLKTLPDQVRETVMLDRMISTLSAAFAALATLLAAVGLYGVLAYTVAQRTREIGVRMALGADAGRVRGMILKQVGIMTLIGGLLGIAGALALGRAAQSLLFGLSGHDPSVVALSAVAVILVAFAAGIVPALRASRVDPMQALRYE